MKEAAPSSSPELTRERRMYLTEISSTFQNDKHDEEEKEDEEGRRGKEEGGR